MKRAGELKKWSCKSKALIRLLYNVNTPCGVAMDVAPLDKYNLDDGKLIVDVGPLQRRPATRGCGTQVGLLRGKGFDHGDMAVFDCL